MTDSLENTYPLYRLPCRIWPKQYEEHCPQNWAHRITPFGHTQGRRKWHGSRAPILWQNGFDNIFCVFRVTFLPGDEKRTIYIYNRSYTTAESDGRTDGRTDRNPINIARQHW